VIGAEYRQEDGTYFDDPFVIDGNTNGVTIGNFDPPAFKVKEAYGELRIPLLKDAPFFEELTVSAAGRISDYSGATGTVYAYNAGIDWAPIEDIRFRANYGRSVRAPNLSELYFPVVANFAPSFQDPCARTEISKNPNRPANCLAQVGGNATILANLPTGTKSLPVLSGSNPNLKEETSDSWTFGAVIQPRFIPGLSLSVDYYDIKVKNVIVSLTAQQIANNCVDQPTTNNVFCTLYERYLGTGPGPLGEATGEIKGNTLVQAGVNFASRQRRGIDVNLNYRTNLTDDIALNTHVIFTHNLKISNYENPANSKFENRVLSELGDPKNEFRWDVDLSTGPVTFGYRMRYIGKMFTSLYENFRPLDSACSTPTNCPPNNLDAIGVEQFPATFYHDLRLEVDVNKTFKLYGGVDNVLNTHAPFGMAGTGTTGTTGDRGTGNAAIYDAFGRKLYVGFKANF
jgi:outer membrane receptor protein involved in Fe transport